MRSPNALRVLFAVLFVGIPQRTVAQDELRDLALRPLLQRNQIIGEWLSAQPLLEDSGLVFSGGYTAEVWGNLAGGRRTGAAYTGLLNFGAELDLGELAGWQGATVSTTWLWLSGRDASADLVGNLLTVSNIAGFDTIRMLELWFEQVLFDGKLSLRVGQLTADSEFFISDYGALFINGTFGWPALTGLNIPGGGPAYPIGTLGARIVATPVEWLTFQSAVFQGNVFAQDVNRYGFDWSLDATTGYTFINEAQIRWNQHAQDPGLPGYLKAGAWFQTGAYADPLVAATDAGNSGYYAIIDQLLYRERVAPRSGARGADDDGQTEYQGLGWFQRIGFAPPGRNFTDLYIDTGLTYRGLLPGRDKDTIGAAFAYAQTSNGGRGVVSDAGYSPAGAEMALEFTYQAAVTPWFIVQPDLQYIINPGSTSNIGNALVIGCRASLVF